MLLNAWHGDYLADSIILRDELETSERFVLFFYNESVSIRAPDSDTAAVFILDCTCSLIRVTGH